MNCTQCGVNNASGAAYCGSCLHPLLTLSGVGAMPQPAQPARQVFSSAPAPAPAVRLVILENLQPTGQAVILPDLAYQGEVLIGRNDLAGGVIVDIDLGKYGGFDRRVSRKQARLHYAAGKLSLADWESKHGTYVNKVRLAGGESRELAPGDEIRLAELVCRLEVVA